MKNVVVCTTPVEASNFNLEVKMKTFATNFILIIMALVWAYLSVVTKTIYRVPVEFLIVGLALAGPEVAKTYKSFKGGL